MLVGGSDSGELFRQTEAWILSLFPAAQAVTFHGAGHDLALTHPAALASTVTQFFGPRAQAAAHERPRR